MGRERSKTRGDQAGFTLIELTIALVVTVIVSGAVFGLMVGGKSAFRKEPELSDRQQQIRIAMSLIERDILMAGQDMGAWFQVFSPGLNNVGSGPVLGTPPAGTALATVVTPAQGGPNVDALEVRGSDGLCPPMTLCVVAGSEFKTIDTRPACMNFPGLVVVTNRETGLAEVIWACEAGGGGAGGACPSGGGGNGHVNVPVGSAPNGCNPANPSENCNQNGGTRLDTLCPVDATEATRLQCDMAALQIVRYEIRVDADGTPNLWRSPTGGLAQGASGLCQPAAAAAAGGTDWQLVARGIEDMQVQYRMGQAPAAGPAAWADQPAIVFSPAVPTAPTVAEWNQLVREVRVTLSARSLAPMLQGQTTSAQGSAVRGQVTRTITPRSAMSALEKGGQRQ